MKVIILAAGKGKRLMSEANNLPKVLRTVNNRSLIAYVTENVNFIEQKDTCVVIGYKGDKVKEELGSGYAYAIQEEQKGTGHAVMCAKEFLKDYDGDVLIVYGDMPLFRKETYIRLIDSHTKSQADCTLLSCVSDKEMAYGRVVRDSQGNYAKVVEDKDCSPEEKKIKELNLGVYVFNTKKLLANLASLKNMNAQGEYYLTDLPSILQANGSKIDIFSIHNDDEILGVNTMEDLEACERILNERK